MEGALVPPAQIDLQIGGVQEGSLQAQGLAIGAVAFERAITGISGERMAQSGQMCADLVHASGFNNNTQEGKFPEVF
jgi:hypothetical protein